MCYKSQQSVPWSVAGAAVDSWNPLRDPDRRRMQEQVHGTSSGLGALLNVGLRKRRQCGLPTSYQESSWLHIPAEQLAKGGQAPAAAHFMPWHLQGNHCFLS